MELKEVRHREYGLGKVLCYTPEDRFDPVFWESLPWPKSVPIVSTIGWGIVRFSFPGRPRRELHLLQQDYLGLFERAYDGSIIILYRDYNRVCLPASVEMWCPWVGLQMSEF